MATTEHARRRSAPRSGRAGRNPAPSTRPEPGARRRSAAFEGYGRDAWGVGLVAAGLLAALGTYLDGAGPAGRGLDLALGAGFGVLRLVVPIAMVAAGVTVLRGAGDDDSTGPGGVPLLGRAALGSALVGLALDGLLHVSRGAPGVSDGIEALGEAGGLVGLAVAGPLQALSATVGAVLVLTAVAVVGVVVLTRMSVRALAATTAVGARPLRSLCRRFGALMRDPSPPAGGPSLWGQPYDQDVGALPGPSPTQGARAGEPKTPAQPTIEVEVPGDRLGGTEPADPEQLAIDLGPAGVRSPWKLPPLALLDRTESQAVDRAAVEERGRVLEGALAQHGVQTRLVGMVVGPSVTRYELELAPGVKVARVTSLHKDIAYAMASPDVRILAPIPGRQAIGVEVPKASRQIVALGDILSSSEARAATHPLEVAVGRDINGKAVLMNLATMPHVLIAGATGAGKSSCLNSLITSVLMRSTPEQVRMILVDPKRVEMGQYDRLPHLLSQVVTNPKKAANALSWAVREMERRYDLLAEVGFRDLDGYNAAYDRGELRAEPGAGREHVRLPYILVVIDELSDLMMVAARDVEESICRIAQMARAVGIHLVIATQRPSVNVITGVIKANIPARLAFAVSSVTDSRVILDQAGAERLIGKGDMLLLGPASSVAQRLQGAWVSEDEVRKVASQWKRQAPELRYDAEVQGTEEATGAGAASGSGGSDDEDLLEEAMVLIVRSQLGSTSMLQRKLRVGFARAGRLMDLLEQRGVVGPSTGSKARDVLMTAEELES